MPRLVNLNDPESMPKIGESALLLSFDRSELESLSLSFSDLLCWHAGFAAAREGAYPLGVHELREFNIAIKRALEE